MKTAFVPVLDVLGNVNVQALDAIQCMVGPRYIDRLVFTAVILLGSISIAWTVVGVLQLCACACGRRVCSRLASKARVAVLGATSVATTVSIQILFLMYPLSCAFILRTWVCDEYSVNGETKQFMADDKFVECTSPEYYMLAAIAAVLVVVVVIGMPALQYWMLSSWMRPFDRLFVPTDEGCLVPSVDGESVLGPLYVLYKPRFHLWALVDAAVKLVFTAVLGVVFKDAQQTGLVAAVLLFAILGFVSALLAPFVHHGSNHIVLATYVAIMANCVEASVSYSMSLQDQTNRAKMLHEVLATATLVLYLLPFAIGFWHLFDVSSWPICRSLKRCRRGMRNGSGAANTVDQQKGGIVKKEQINLFQEKDIIREAQLDHRRSRALTVLLNDIRPLAGQAVVLAVFVSSTSSVARKGKRKAAWKDQLSNAVKAYDDAANAALEAIREFPLALTWKHCTDIESAARQLSKLVFKERADAMKGGAAGEGGHHGIVVLAFANVQALWRNEIAVNVCAQEADGDDTAVPSMAGVVVCRNAVIALLCPGANMGSCKMIAGATAKGGGGGGGAGHVRSQSRAAQPGIDGVESKQQQQPVSGDVDGTKGGSRRNKSATSSKMSAVFPVAAWDSDETTFAAGNRGDSGIGTNVMAMSAGDLRQFCRQNRVDTVGCIEMADVQERALLFQQRALLSQLRTLRAAGNGATMEMKQDSQMPQPQLVRLTPQLRDTAREASLTLERLLAGQPSPSPSPGRQTNTCTTRMPVLQESPQSSRSALRFASPALRGDVHVVMAAVREDGEALQYASAELQGHRGVVLAAVNGEGAEHRTLRTDRVLVYGADNTRDTGDGGELGERSLEEVHV